MYKIQNWKDMNSWLKFFVFFHPICLIIMVGIGIREYLSGDLNGDYFYSLLMVFLMMFSTFGMFGLFVKKEKGWTLSPLNPKILDFLNIEFSTFHFTMIDSYIIKTHKWFEFFTHSVTNCTTVKWLQQYKYLQTL